MLNLCCILSFPGQIRKKLVPDHQKFGSLDALLMELNRAGHPDDQIWFYCNDLGIPEALQAADSRLIAERHANGSWWTV
ncbi:hypothetical protein XO74_004856, partial [Salmonella enterica subsp. enterica serovar Anatum]|nr:hypothetical protein [Salmonella enterica subsp. enterica serovar Anatum]